MTYSVAIRTLGTSPVFRQELESLHRQTIMPEKIMVYIAEGYKRPAYTIGKEEYVWVPKGMVRQRALQYKEIDSDYILFLDDDVELDSNTAELLLQSAEVNCADCVGADTFKNHEMSFAGKLYAILTNLVFPRLHDQWAFKIHRNGSFSYNNYPKKGFYLSQSCAGPAWLCKKSAFLDMHFEDETWLDSLGFPFGEDSLETYKFYKNGYKLGVYYESGIRNLDAKTSSGSFQKDSKKFYTRSFASFSLWWRMIYDIKDDSGLEKFFSVISYGFKSLWLFIINIFASLYARQLKIPYLYIKGIRDGWKYVHSNEYKKIPSYILKYRK